MRVKTCPRCNKLFKSDARSFCPVCQKIEDEEFRLVRDYLRANRDAVLMEIVEVTGVESRKILDYIKRGRIEIQKHDFGVFVKCEICGKPVSRGTLCLSCYTKMVKPLREPPVEEEVEEKEESKIKPRRRRRISIDQQNHIYFNRDVLKKENSESE